MEARIYQPTKTAMQSGLARTRAWVLEFAPEDRKRREALMGWTSSRDTRQQVQLRFETRQAAVAYAEKHAIPYRVEAPRTRQVRPKSYAANFRWQRPA